MYNHSLTLIRLLKVLERDVLVSLEMHNHIQVIQEIYYVIANHYRYLLQDIFLII